MKLIQAQVPEAEYYLIKRRAKESGKTMQALVREALRALLVPDSVDPSDPIFTELPVLPRTGRRERTSIEHDELLYRKRP